MTKQPVILASTSPRRKILFRYIGVPFEVRTGTIDESIMANEIPESYVLRMSYLKAKRVHGKIDKKFIVVGVDTIIELGGSIFGKPLTLDMATKMLTKLNGKCHRVLTGVTVLGGINSSCLSGIETTSVTFRQLSDLQISNYVITGEPLGKAGGYAIQGNGISLIEILAGSYSNVIGLPLRLTQALLIKTGCLLDATNTP